MKPSLNYITSAVRRLEPSNLIILQESDFGSYRVIVLFDGPPKETIFTHDRLEALTEYVKQLQRYHLHVGSPQAPTFESVDPQAIIKSWEEEL